MNKVKVKGLSIKMLELLLAVLIGLIIGYFLPSYAKKKGENLATKEDIAEITSKIESVKFDFQHNLEKERSQLQVIVATEKAFKENALEAIKDIDNLLVRISIYSWQKLAELSPNEHYVWDNVAEPDDNVKAGFHYFRVAVDRAILVHGLYLSPNARKSLHNLADQIGLLSSMEIALTQDNPDPLILKSADNGYQTALDSVQKCRDELMQEFGLVSKKTAN